MNDSTLKPLQLSIPNLAGNEWNYIKECLDTNWISSVGSYVTLFEQRIAEFTGVKYAIATSNGTAALHIALQLANVKKNDYVIVPNITFIASLNSIKYIDANPILIDIDKETWQIDLELLKVFLETKTYQKNNFCYLIENNRPISAIMPVHVLGNMCDMTKLMEIADLYNIAVIEDSTEALGSYHNNKHAGSFGLAGTLSFNGNKIITTGGGGMILTNDENLAIKAKHLTTQAKADSKEYYHDEIGYNYRLVNVLAAIGVAQLELLPQFLVRKKEIDGFYKQNLPQIGDFEFQKVGENVNPNNWLFTTMTSKQKQCLAICAENKIEARPFWVPMNQLPMFKDDIYFSLQNISQEVYSKCISLPCSTSVTDSELERVVSTLNKINN